MPEKRGLDDRKALIETPLSIVGFLFVHPGTQLIDYPPGAQPISQAGALHCGHRLPVSTNLFFHNATALLAEVSTLLW